MKNLAVSISVCMLSIGCFAQQTYCNFEGYKVIHFGQVTGVLDSTALNAVPNTSNNSANCAMYIRDSASTYDFIKIHTDTTMVDITPYASNTFQAPRIKMKVYSTAPVGTIIQIQLGLAAVDNYPAGIHSEYMAATTVQYAWEEITFNYYQSPTGSLAQPTDIDKMVILFRPGANTRDTMYFDDIKGPNLLSHPGGIANMDAPAPFRLFQNHPNPSADQTHISFQLNSSGIISLKLYDLLGNPVSTIVEQNMRAGTYSFPLETMDIPNGIYFYVLKKDGLSQAMRMTVSK